ncbi:phosphoribosylanthranilate isomerase [Altererythrobacter sp. H2]|uniref:phosphoribosylanthranilate isomerase n=1 Tax=Altererythrobacter sp. H2 TaxID=3108391 RepID=UPI002B4C22E3|nr:phosphoribosylanthranilate isomerase [Altererythrobacter sp. H2]WRK96996.1 phosphoribosylanthranilate isomerase [Altererythrobacter sp. H2]
MAQIKICGVNTPEAVDACVAAQADWCGLVFYPPSPRNLTPSEAAVLAGHAGARIGKVGLFVDADDLAIAEGIRAGSLDAVQLHGHESPERTAQVRQRFGLPVWKALPVASAADVARAMAYRDAADLILFDAKTPKGALPGGMGLAFDWSLVARWKGPLPWGLAGGLSPANAAEALRQTGAPLLDTSSGVESAPGVKDPALITAFCGAARGA